METTMNDCNSPCLYEKVIHKAPLYRAYACFHGVLLLCFLGYRLMHFLDESHGLIWFIALSCELWSAFQWLLYHNIRWQLIEYKAYPERLACRYGGESASKLPPVDIIITSTDPFKEPAIITANTVLSVLAVDFPVQKIACYVSDDGASPITFYSLVETFNFAKTWVPFCRKFNVEERAPLLYFSKQTKCSDPEFLQEWQSMKDSYESLKRKITKALETGQVPLDSVSHNGLDGFAHKGSEIRNHSSIVKVIHECKVGQGNETDVLPHFIYVAREKRPQVPHHYKAGAMNVMARVSGVMTNAPFILNLDCDMHVSNPKVIQHAMCFFLDCPSEKECGFVQFPQLFYGGPKDDPFGSQLKLFFTFIAKGMNSIQGPMYGGTCCFHRRKGLYGMPPPADQYNSKGKNLEIQGKQFQYGSLRSAFGESSALVASAEAIMTHPNVLHNPPLPSVAMEEALEVASCGYEANTAWGKDVGWMYGSTVEDVMTGLRVHSLGWHSIYHMPEQPAFMGCAPSNGPDSLVQQKRWSTGSLEIFCSKLCPFLPNNRKLTRRQRMVYAFLTLQTFTSLSALCYSILPAFSLLSGKSFLPKIHEAAFSIAVGLSLSIYGYRISEYILCGCSIREWWNNQRMRLISALSTTLFALFDVMLKLMGLSETVFVVTPKGSGDDNDDQSNKGEFTFNSSPLFIPPTTVLLINLAAIFHGILGCVIVKYENKDKLLVAELFCSVWVVINLLPFLKGLVRKGKRGLPWTVVIKSSVLALFLCRSWAKFSCQ